jgi:hypothetical protein
MSSPSSLPRPYVKLVHVNIETDKEECKNQQQLFPIIFVRYQKTILIPDFNICSLLKMINPSINIHAIEHYVRIYLFIKAISFFCCQAFAIRYNGVHITQESNFDIFTQLSSLIDIRYIHNIGLYTLDFVGYILEHYNFRVVNVILALENAKSAQLHASDLALWFSMDNEVNKLLFIIRKYVGFYFSLTLHLHLFPITTLSMLFSLIFCC